MTSETEKSIKDLRIKIKDLSTQISEVNEQINQSAKVSASITKARNKIANFERYYESFKRESVSEFEVIGITIDYLVKIEIDTSLLDQYEKENQLKMVKLKNSLDYRIRLVVMHEKERRN